MLFLSDAGHGFPVFFVVDEAAVVHEADDLDAGEVPDGFGKVGNEVCGDIMQITLKIENDRIVDAKFKTFGCAAAVATSSTATDMVKGMTVDEAWNLTNKVVIEKLGGLPPQKLHCSVLAEEAIKAAIEDYRNKQAAKKAEKQA